jgi:hypothetical protein
VTGGRRQEAGGCPKYSFGEVEVEAVRRTPLERLRLRLRRIEIRNKKQKIRNKEVANLW